MNVVCDISQNITFNSLKILSLDQFPLSYLARDPSWKFFTKTSVENVLKADTQICKVSEGERTYLGVVYCVNKGVCAVGKLDKRVRMRDIKRFDLISSSDNRRADQTMIDEDYDLLNPFARASLPSFWSCGPTRKTPEIKLDLNPVLAPIESPAPLEFLRGKYHETLYVSKTPLAYFAKSTLSRLRALCAEKETDNNSARHVEILKACILDIEVLDVKYVSQVDEFRAFLVKLQNAREQQQFFSIPKGYSQQELSFLKQWSDKLESKQGDKLRVAIDVLKIREIQLQVILLLELLSIIGNIDSISSCNNTASQSKKKKRTSSKTNRLVRKRDRKKVAADSSSEEEKLADSTTNLTISETPAVLLDVLFDRLCIWQAVEGGANRKNDKILEFCMEVILPYFGSSLPQKTKELARKAKGLSATKKSQKLQQLPQRCETSSTDITTPMVPTALTATTTSTVSMAMNDIPTAALDKSLSKTVASKVPLHLSQVLCKENESISPKSNLVASEIPTTTAANQYTKKSKERWQVEMTRAIRKENIAEELAAAIKNVAKPNRFAATKSQNIISNTAAVQVPGATLVTATPSRKRLKQFEYPPIQNEDSSLFDPSAFVTPKKPRHEDDTMIQSSPICSPLFVRSTPLKELSQ